MKVFINPSSLQIAENGLQAEQVTLSISQKVAADLNAAGVTTELQQLDSVDAIVEVSNNSGADLFVAIHCNSATPSASGTETFYCQGSVNGEKLAQLIQTRIISKLGTTDRGIKDDTQAAGGRLAVLRNTTCPAVLVETAFISNAGDAQLLRDRQDDFAKAISAGILDYCGINVSASTTAATAAQSASKAAEPVPVLNVDIKVVGAKVRKYDSKDDLENVSVGSDDTTYGIYQLSSKKKTINAFVDWLCNHSDSAFANYGKSLAANEINSDAFIEAWKNLASVDPGNFSQLQDDFVKANYFDKANEALVRENFHLSKHGDNLRTEIFTRAYQNGVSACVESVKQACNKLGQPNLSYIDDKFFDEKIIGAM